MTQDRKVIREGGIYGPIPVEEPRRPPAKTFSVAEATEIAQLAGALARNVARWQAERDNDRDYAARAAMALTGAWSDIERFHERTGFNLFGTYHPEVTDARRFMEDYRADQSANLMVVIG